WNKHPSKCVSTLAAECFSPSRDTDVLPRRSGARLPVRPANENAPFGGLYALARHTMQQDPISGHVFAFINRRANQIKVLYFDRT
ncbi:IS66 family insertion sequence element accessory protein TnpB, partial [Undibacterium sp. Xuan67W]|uniref:IS66 family insertion sequence element accessory protein TnpB n=1 Tax=Undibacterium sp. Xuan67W TaxID=3413057 RepID=UPI003BF401F9